MTEAPETFEYSPWRHGGWYVHNVRYPSGAIGCVSRNYADRKWRIADDERPGDHTYRTRDEAARAEWEMIRDRGWLTKREQDVADHARVAFDLLNNLTTDEFANGGDQPARAALFEILYRLKVATHEEWYEYNHGEPVPA